MTHPEQPAIACPSCSGTGQVGPVHINYGGGHGEWKDKVPCYRCTGTGTATPEMIAWMARGKALRDARLARGETLGAAAERLSINPAALSAMEEGRRDPARLEQATGGAS